MSLPLFILITFLTLKVESSCDIFTDPNPVSFHLDEGNKICSATTNPLCFKYRATRDGNLLERAGGCADWLKEVAEKGQGLLEDLLANAYGVCRTGGYTSFSENRNGFLVQVECFPGGGTEVLDREEETSEEYPDFDSPPTVDEAAENETESDLPTATTVCPVSANHGSFDERQGLEICRNAASPWCFQFTSTILHGLILTGKVSGCSEWMENLAKDPSLSQEQRHFFANAYAICSSVNGRGYEKRWWWFFEAYNVACKPTYPEEVEKLLNQPVEDAGVARNDTAVHLESNETTIAQPA